jgi:hypothetical protein
VLTRKCSAAHGRFYEGKADVSLAAKNVRLRMDIVEKLENRMPTNFARCASKRLGVNPAPYKEPAKPPLLESELMR